jgi:hypothetical protein
MAARTKGRAKFDFRGRPFVWWIDNDQFLRIVSLDKKFVIAYLIGTDSDEPVVEVNGPEFPGIERPEPRPLWFVAPDLPRMPMGGWVDHLLRWSFDTDQKRQRVSARPRFL